MRKISSKFLLIFSVCLLSLAGVLLACGGYEDDSDSYLFNPEYFLSKEYGMFFYNTSEDFYRERAGSAADKYIGKTSDEMLPDEWDTYLEHQLPVGNISFLLFKADSAGIDSVYRYINGNIERLSAAFPAFPKDIPGRDKRRVKRFLDYLTLAKQCEKFATHPGEDEWDIKPDTVPPAPALEAALARDFKKTGDSFIRAHLWFQMVRLDYFADETSTRNDSLGMQILRKSPIASLFYRYANAFPKNLIYYRAMGYLAGYYYRHNAYGPANYLYSLCFANTYGLKESSDWSFHPQNESDWRETLGLARNKNEQITLWLMLGAQDDDPLRAMREIARLNPRAKEMEPMLGILVNLAESEGDTPSINPSDLNYDMEFPFDNDSASVAAAQKHNDSAATAAYNSVFHKKVEQRIAGDKRLHFIDSLVALPNMPKPYYWRLAAGYLHYMDDDFSAAGKYYSLTAKEIPAGDTLATAQCKLLLVLLDVHGINHIDKSAERRLTAPLNWLADLHAQKKTFRNLNYDDAFLRVSGFMSDLYSNQGERIKAACFGYDNGFYNSYDNIESLLELINKQDKSPYEEAIVRYAPYGARKLYYQQALIMTYNENISKAIELIKKAGEETKNESLCADPFTSRLNDCHDCDQADPKKHIYSTLDFLLTLKKITSNLHAGKNVYANARLMANACYNITYFGNNRCFYSGNLFSFRHATVMQGFDTLAYNPLPGQEIAEKYYNIALKNAHNDEQRAFCTFMLSKCERNDSYPIRSNLVDEEGELYDIDNSDFPTGSKYFRMLQDKYSATKYYAEVLHECGYFKYYVDSVVKAGHRIDVPEKNQ